MLGAMATVTELVTLGAMVFPLARRRPWKVARESITIDHLSNGRLVMPVGLGAADDGGFSRVNTDTPDRKIRAQRLDECLAILDLAWSGERFSFTGEHYQAVDLVFRPKPVQQPRIPVWVVGQWPSVKSMSRAARWDGILPWVPDNPPATPIPAGKLVEIRDWMRAHRESDAPFEIVLEGRTSGTDHAANREQLQPLAEAGATWWIESRWDETDTSESLLERIRQGPPRV
jgi:alkanesulfonate monooxygenase SsuD/methylene tetrahydromethanopterin reductase-like flavin-dependent oxidoreductase (luciferase family)